MTGTLIAAWIVVCTSVELFILLGRLPAIGIYIYMSLSVLKTVVLFVIIYSPVLLGFTTAFYTLRHTKDSFENYFNAFLRVRYKNWILFYGGGGVHEKSTLVLIKPI